MLTLNSLLRLIVCAFSSLSSSSAYVLRDGIPGTYSEVDVAIIGGGSSGTNAAVRLYDMNKTIALIEPKPVLGGHSETYVDPKTGGKINIGVVLYTNTSYVREYFSRLNVTLAPYDGLMGKSIPIDFRTGQMVRDVAPKNVSARAAAIAEYSAQVNRYPQLLDGYYLSDFVQEDLLLPFGAFAQKYNLGPIVNEFFEYDQGQGDILNTTTLYIIKILHSDFLEGLATTFIAPASGDISEIYRRAQVLLGSSVFANTTVAGVDRTSSNSSVTLSLNTPTGAHTIKASKLLIAVPPVLSNVGMWDLSSTERTLFSQFNGHTYNTGVLRNTGIPANTTLLNTAVDMPYGLPHLPAPYSFYGSPVPGLVNVKYGGDQALPPDQTQADILAALQRIGASGSVPVSADAEFATFSSHTPFLLYAPVDAIRDGFYKKLYALQGQRNTWWTGAAWEAQDSSLLWRFNNRLLKQMFPEEA